jgi:hypothetical protein
LTCKTAENCIFSLKNLFFSEVIPTFAQTIDAYDEEITRLIYHSYPLADSTGYGQCQPDLCGWGDGFPDW